MRMLKDILRSANRKAIGSAIVRKMLSATEFLLIVARDAKEWIAAHVLKR